MKEIAEITDQILFPLDKIKDLRGRGKQYKVLVGWKGYAASSDSWEPLQIMNLDLSGEVREFFKGKLSNTLTLRAEASIGL